MTMRVPFSITKQTISFYAKGRSYSLSADSPQFGALRAALQTPQDQDHDKDALIGLVDVRQGLVNQSNGEIVLIDESIVFRGQALHNVWVEKILDFRAANEPYEPIWNALSKLVHNPTPAAIERLPIFLERTGLGFLPDGRFIAFKGVGEDLRSLHSNLDGTYFTHEIGAKLRMDRSEVDADPNRTCSHGLHVGAQGYVGEYYSGRGKQVVLVAVDPVDVVAVPTDYNGEKMRVCGYEVIDHLAADFSDELLGRLKTTVKGYTPEPTAPITNLARLAQVGDVVTIRGVGDSIVQTVVGGIVVTPGISVADELVVAVKRGGVFVGDIRQELYQAWLDDQPDEDLVEDEDEDEDEDDGEDDATLIEVDGDTVTMTSLDGHDLRGEPEALVTSPDRAEPGDLISVINSSWPPDGVYPVIKPYSEGYIVRTEHDGDVWVDGGDIDRITRRPWMRAEIGGTVVLGAKSWPHEGQYEVIDLQLDGPNPQVQVRTPSGPWWVAADRVISVEPKPVA